MLPRGAPGRRARAQEGGQVGQPLFQPVAILRDRLAAHPGGPSVLRDLLPRLLEGPEGANGQGGLASTGEWPR